MFAASNIFQHLPLIWDGVSQFEPDKQRDAGETVKIMLEEIERCYESQSQISPISLIFGLRVQTMNIGKGT